MNVSILPRTRAQESRAAIERIYIIMLMRHLFIRGYYKPHGASGAALKEALLALQPEIYGSIADSEKVELNGLVYVIGRLPRGIEKCRFVKLVAAEGYGESGLEKIIPAKRRRNCYHIDSDNPLRSGSTLASGSLGQLGVKPAYGITLKFLNQIFASHCY